MNRKAFLACVLMCVILTGCETAKKISEVIKNPGYPGREPEGATFGNNRHPADRTGHQYQCGG